MKNKVIFSVLLLCAFVAKAQFSIYNIGVSNPSNANQLVDKLVGTGVTYLNATFTGSYGGTEAGNAGFFSGGINDVGINNGIILSTGNVGKHWYTNTYITNTNTYFNLGTATGTGSDATLNAIIGATTYDKAVLEFDFIPESDYIEFRYVFASEEYNEWVNSQYNDVFGFFVTSLEADGYNYSNKNIAIVPGTSNTPVAINTINNGPCYDPQNEPWGSGVGPCTNCAYYIDNTIAGKHIEYDGLTTVLTASCPVTPCKLYHMKIAIADVSDQWLDSGVLLEENSFISPVINNIGYTTSNPQAGNGTNMVEGCSNGIVTFTLNAPTPMNRNVPFTLGGTAQFGVDYYTIPDISGTFSPPNNYYVTIPQNQISTTLTIVPLSDGSVEGTESIDFGIQTNLCDASTILTQTVYILDNSTPFSTSLPPSVDICNGNSTDLTVTVNGGQTPFSYSWSSGHNTSTISVNPSTTTTYTVTVTDACGAESTSSSTVNVYPVPSAIPSASSQAICSGNSTNISIGSNVQNATFSWTASSNDNITGYSNGTGSDIQQTLINNETTPGTVTYSIIATANGCTGNPATVVVTVNPSPVITSVDVLPNTVCVGTPDGSITVNATGGTPPLNYSIDGGALQPNNVFTQLGTGTHNVLVQDANGCQATYNNILVSGTSGPTINQILVTNVICYGDNTGSIVIDATGATEYSIDNGTTWQSSNTFNNLAAGTYSILVKDAGECLAPSIAVVNSPDELTATFTTVDEHCGTPGSASISISGGVAPYTYLWSTGDTTSSINGIHHGTYTVTVTDSNACTSVFTVNVEYQGGNVQLYYVTNNVACYGDSTGIIQLSISNITPPYTVNWSHTSDTSLVQQNLPAGTYNVTVSDTYGCTAYATITIEQPQPLSVTYQATNPSCYNSTDGQITVNTTGGVSPYTYLWTNGENTSTISSLSEGYYGVTITDANNCTFVQQPIQLTNPPQLVVSNSATDPVCYNGNDGMIIATASGGTPPYQYQWPGGISNDTITGISSGTYTVTVVDANYCTASATSILYNPPPIIINGQVQITNHLGSIDVTVEGGMLPYVYSWSNGATTEDIDNLGGGTFILTVTDANNCSVIDTFFVDIPLEIPTVITPNGDGKNDDFEIVGIQGYENVSIEIYGRWGNKLFDFKGTGLEYFNKSNRWNGKYNGKDLPMGAYIYIIKLNDNEPITGVVTIVI